MNFRKRQSSSPQGFQLAAMVDVVFLLLTFFVATQMFAQWETEIDITVPTARTGMSPDRLPGEIILNITKEGAVVFSGETLDAGRLRSKLSRLAELWPGQPVLIRADGDTDYRNVIQVVDMCRECDIYRLSFATGLESEDDGESESVEL